LGSSIVPGLGATGMGKKGLEMLEINKKTLKQKNKPQFGMLKRASGYHYLSGALLSICFGVVTHRRWLNKPIYISNLLLSPIG